MAHWKEYDEALEHYERTNLFADENISVAGQEQASAKHPVENGGQATTGHRCGSSHVPAASGMGTPGHYHSVALPMSDAIFSKVLALVTSGLLDCSHSVRAVETEMRTTLARPDLASLVGQVQGMENGVLRHIVERDQNKRIAKVEGRDLSAVITQHDQAVQQQRSLIQDVMAEINAEMAELAM